MFHEQYVPMESILKNALAEYVRALGCSADATDRAEDRGRYQSHLAAAARMFADIEAGDLQSLVARVAVERRNFGSDYLSGDAGARAEQAWVRFATEVERL